MKTNDELIAEMQNQNPHVVIAYIIAGRRRDNRDITIMGLFTSLEDTKTAASKMIKDGVVGNEIWLIPAPIDPTFPWETTLTWQDMYTG